MIETFLIGLLSAAIPVFLFYTIGGKKTLYVFIGLCVLGLLVGVFEDIDFSSSDAQRQANTDNLIEKYSKKLSCDKNDTEDYWIGDSYGRALPDCAYMKGTPADRREIVVGNTTYSLPIDSVSRCKFWYEFEKKYGFTEDLSVFTFEGQKIKETINGIEETWIMPKKKGDRCIVYAEIENIKDGLYINGRP